MPGGHANWVTFVTHISPTFSAEGTVAARGKLGWPDIAQTCGSAPPSKKVYLWIPHTDIMYCLQVGSVTREDLDLVSSTTVWSCSSTKVALWWVHWFVGLSPVACSIRHKRHMPGAAPGVPVLRPPAADTSHSSTATCHCPGAPDTERDGSVSAVYLRK